MESARILLLDFAPSDETCRILRSILESCPRLEIKLRREHFAIANSAFSYNKISATTSRFNPEVILLILPPRFLSKAEILFQSIKGAQSKAAVIIITDASEPEKMLELLKLGVSDFITSPLKAVDILPRVWRLLEQTDPEDAQLNAIKERVGLKRLVGESCAFIAEKNKLPLMAKCDASILILGETGTGKELCARAIHYLSARADKPFVPINCGAIPVDLVENELFGHERDAFTGASTARAGLIREAEGGTLFFDEVDCLPLLAQVKLLRFLQEKEYRPLGSTKMRRANVRVISATNANLEKALTEGKLRQDLYYRLNIIPLRLPPLRERPEDIPILARHFLEKYVNEFNKEGISFSSESTQALLLYNWPGNVRELEYVIERAVALCEQNLIRGSDIVLPDWESSAHQEPFQKMKARMIAQFEKNYLQGLLLSCQGNITKAAQLAQKNRRAFWQLIRKHHIDVQSLKHVAKTIH